LILTIDGSNSRSGGAVTYLSNLLNYAEPEKCGIKKIVLFGHSNLLKFIKEKEWLQMVFEPQLDRPLPFRLRWLWIVFPKLIENSDLVFLPGANYVDLKIPYVSISQNLLPFSDARKMFGFSKRRFRYEYLRLSQSKCFEKSRGMIFPNNYTKKVVLEKLKKAPNLIKIIPHGIPKRFFFKPKVQKWLRNYSNEKPFKFFFSSAISIYKYHSNVVKAFSILRKMGYPITLDFAGDISYLPAFRHLSKTIKIYDPDNNFVRYLGSIPYGEIHNLYKNYDAFIFSSTCETFGFPLFEAMASGLPVVASDFGLTREILGENTIYFDPRKPEEIVEAVVRLVEDKNLREEIAWSNYRKSKDYSWEKCADETFKFLKLCLDSDL